MKELSKEDQERIRSEANRKLLIIARKEGFNEALEEVNELITNILSKECYKDDYRDEILKLKK